MQTFRMDVLALSLVGLLGYAGCGETGDSKRHDRSDEDEDKDKDKDKDKDRRDRGDDEDDEDGDEDTKPKGTDVPRWLDVKWSKVKGDARGISFEAEVPDGLPANPEFMIGSDWFINYNREAGELLPGPRLTLSRLNRSFPDPEAFAAYVQDPAGKGVEKIVLEKLPDGRLRYVHATKEKSHLDVGVWIPWNDEAGVHCSAHYWGGSDDDAADAEIKPRDKVVAWLDKFCASVRLSPATSDD